SGPSRISTSSSSTSSPARSGHNPTPDLAEPRPTPPQPEQARHHARTSRQLLSVVIRPRNKSRAAAVYQPTRLVTDNDHRLRRDQGDKGKGQPQCECTPQP